MVYSPAILTIPCERIADAKEPLRAGAGVTHGTAAGFQPAAEKRLQSPNLGCENRSSVHHALTPAEKVRRQVQARQSRRRPTIEVGVKCAEHAGLDPASAGVTSVALGASLV